MKYLRLLLLPIFLFIIACTASKPFTTEYDTQMINSFDGYYTSYQLDSICVADTLEPINQWYMIPLRDDETKQNVSQYLYIKSLGQYESIYRVQIINDSTYKITKRITK